MQTVRYRLRQLRELLGDAALDEPEARFELSVALRVDGSIVVPGKDARSAAGAGP